MRLLRAQKGKLVFSLKRAEQKVFLEVLELYPLVPGAHQSLSKTLQGQQGLEAQQLLNEALAEHRASNKLELDQWLTTPSRFRVTKTGCTMVVPLDNVEWLLQILNDIRVGSWLLLGSPEDHLEPEEIEPALRPLWAAMELCGLFQTVLLHGADQASPN